MVKELQIEFTDKKVTAWGGMKLMKDMLDSICIKELMGSLELPAKGSNRGYESIQIIECFWTSIWIGAGRFSHSAYLRYDKVLQEIFGWKQAPSQSTYSRFFQKFSWKRHNTLIIKQKRGAKAPPRDPEGIRTPNQQNRNLSFYPIELRSLKFWQI
jgi:hypothetical protein